MKPVVVLVVVFLAALALAEQEQAWRKDAKYWRARNKFQRARKLEHQAARGAHGVHKSAPMNESEVEQLADSINVWELVTGKKVASCARVKRGSRTDITRPQMACADVESPRKQRSLRRFNVVFEAALGSTCHSCAFGFTHAHTLLSFSLPRSRTTLIVLH